MQQDKTEAAQLVVVRVYGQVCALPLLSVIETMRPLPIDTLSGIPKFVRGVAIIRGIPTPVVDVGALLGLGDGGAFERFITIHAGERQVALAVSSVLGIRNLKDMTAVQTLPPLLADAAKEVIETIGVLDEELLIVLRGSWRLPGEVWDALAMQETASWR